MSNYRRPYFLLVEQAPDGKWSVQFGDHDAETVKLEREDRRYSDRYLPKADRHGPMRLLRSANASQTACNAALEALNGGSSHGTR
jgi:hypothetical protein